MPAAIQWITTEDGRKIPLGQKNAQAAARGGAREKAIKGARKVVSRPLVLVESPDKIEKALKYLGVDQNEAIEAMIPSLGGKFDKVSISSVGGQDFWVGYDGEHGTITRKLHRDSYGNLSCWNEHFELKETGTGLGTEFFNAQVKGLADMGVKSMGALAAKGTNVNGYYTWPRLGYDGEIPNLGITEYSGKTWTEAPKDVRAALRSGGNVSELMKTKEGRDWWKEKGMKFRATFDLTEGSYSRKVLDAYMEERVKRGLGEKTTEKAPAEKTPAPSPASQSSKDTSVRFRTLDGGWDPKREKDVHLPLLAKIAHGVPPVDTPTLFMTGGGYGSGKSAVVEHTFPKANEAVHVDPDGLKKGIPEFHELASQGDAGAATAVHEESSHIAKRAVKENLSSDRHVVYDSSGDSGIEKLHAKVQDFRAAGAERVVANYAFPGSIDEAISRADARAKKQKEGGETPRFVPHALLRENHHDVSSTWQAAAKRGTFDELNLYSTAGKFGSKPELIASAQGGKITVHKKDEFDRFVALSK